MRTYAQQVALPLARSIEDLQAADLHERGWAVVKAMGIPESESVGQLEPAIDQATALDFMR